MMIFFKKSLLVGALALIGANSFAVTGANNLTIGPLKSMNSHLPKATDIYKASDAELELVKQYSLITYRNIVDGLGFSDKEVRQFAQTILDSLDKKSVEDVSPEDYQKLIAYLNERGQKIQRVMLEAQAEQNIKLGKVAFEEYVKEGAKVDPEQPGVAYTILKEGSGRQVKDTDVVKVTYKGSFIDGRVFDQSLDPKNPSEFPLQGLIPGFKYAATKLKVGGSIKALIAYDQAYGLQGNQAIPGGSYLYFEFTIIDAKSGSSK